MGMAETTKLDFTPRRLRPIAVAVVRLTGYRNRPKKVPYGAMATRWLLSLLAVSRIDGVLTGVP